MGDEKITELGGLTADKIKLLNAESKEYARTLVAESETRVTKYVDARDEHLKGNIITMIGNLEHLLTLKQDHSDDMAKEHAKAVTAKLDSLVEATSEVKKTTAWNQKVLWLLIGAFGLFNILLRFIPEIVAHH